MATSPDSVRKRSIRKLVSLPPDLAERVEQFRESSRATSESEALKLLIEAGLKMRDKPEDLFRRCKTATESGQSIGDIINLMTSDHPLVDSTVLDGEALIVNLKTESDTPRERFRYSRSRHTWEWEIMRNQGYEEYWEPIKRGPEKRGAGVDLDDEIPF